MWNDILKLAGVAWGYLKNLFLTWATYVGNTFIIILNAFIWAMNQMLKYAGNILSAILNGFIRAWNEVASHSFGVLSTISKVSFNWGIGYIGMMGSIGASAGSAFSNGFAANAKVSGIISAEQSGKLETATFVHGRWVDAKTNKPLSGAQQKEATARFRARMGFKKGEPGGPTEGSQQDITGPKAGNPKVNIAIPSPGSVSVPTGPTPLNPGDFLTPTTKKKHKAKHHKAASGISNDPAYVAQEQAVAAARLKGTRAYRLALLKEEEWLKNRLKDSKLSAKKKLAYEKALYTVERELTAATKKQESMALADEKARYQIAIAIAERKGLAAGTGKNATVIQRRIKQMELDMLQEEEDRVKAMLRKKGLSLKQQASLQTQWTSLERKMSAIQATYTPGVLTFQNAPGKIKRALAKAARTTTLKDDIAAMEEERKWLEKMVNNKKLSLAMHMKYSDELRKLNLRIEEERRKIISSQNQLSLSEKELAAAMDVRGSFFAQFAGNIFGGSPGGLTLQPGTHGGGGGKSVKVEQNNTYNQPPPDPHQHAAAMRRAASGAMSGL
jgi:hypothetical protein